MPVQISIPASEVKNHLETALILENGQRCSRCDQSAAEYFEIHRLHYRVGFKLNHLYGKKYRISKSYVVKLKVCKTCFQSDFLTHPDLMDNDRSPLARIARFHSLAWTIGGLLAACGFLLLTPIIPQNGVLGTIKQMWQIPVVMGVIVLFLSWLSQKKYQTKVLRELEKSNPSFQPLARTEVHTYVLRDEEDLTATALEIILLNETWGKECAAQHNWHFEQISNTENDTLNKG